MATENRRKDDMRCGGGPGSGQLCGRGWTPRTRSPVVLDISVIKSSLELESDTPARGSPEITVVVRNRSEVCLAVSS
ncbi:hypothetical protein ACHAQJ_008268 [Trichoderma viride]